MEVTSFVRSLGDPDPLTRLMVVRELELSLRRVELRALVEARKLQRTWQEIAYAGGWASRQAAHARLQRLSGAEYVKFRDLDAL